MKRNLLKRIGAVSLAVAVSLTMGTAAFAETSPARDAGTPSTDNALTITKEIAYFNPQSAIEINYPAVEYTYSIAAANPTSAKVTDKDNHEATVKAGVSGGVAMDTDNKATFAAGSIAASQKGVLKSDPFGVTVDPTKFSSAGVYRYALTETAPDNLAALGYERATTSTGTRYLDVYLKNKEGASGLEVYGYVLFYGSENDSIKSKDLEGGSEDAKTEGFVHEATGTDPDYSSDAYIDKYKTYNVEVTKTVTGGLGDKNNKFPINVAVEAGASASDVVITGNVDTEGLATVSNITLASGAADKGEVATIADGGKVTFIGIPVGSKLSVSETNNTNDTYAVTADGLTGGPSNESVAAGAESAVGTVTTANVEKKTTGFTNNLDQVSPTNVVMRFAPYLFILAAAIVLLVLMRRRKAHNDAE